MVRKKVFKKFSQMVKNIFFFFTNILRIMKNFLNFTRNYFVKAEKLTNKKNKI